MHELWRDELRRRRHQDMVSWLWEGAVSRGRVRGGARMSKSRVEHVGTIDDDGLRVEYCCESPGWFPGQNGLAGVLQLGYGRARR